MRDVIQYAASYAFGLLLILGLVTCSHDDRDDDRHVPVYQPCTSEPHPEGAILTCPDGSRILIRDGKPGADGKDGEQGTAGQNGINGQNGRDGIDGKAGVAGRDGVAGKDGQAGSSCSVERVQNGAIIRCTDGTTSLVMDGLNGADGRDGTDGAAGKDGVDGVNGKDGVDGANGRDGTNGRDGAVMEIVDPCGDTPNKFDEILFRLSNGVLVAYFESGSNRYLSVIPPGTYKTTDGNNCIFTVDSQLQVRW